MGIITEEEAVALGLDGPEDMEAPARGGGRTAAGAGTDERWANLTRALNSVEASCLKYQGIIHKMVRFVRDLREQGLLSPHLASEAVRLESLAEAVPTGAEEIETQTKGVTTCTSPI